MLVSYNWLQEYFDTPLPKPSELAELLTFHAYEVEGVQQVGDDHVLDVDILPNRSADSLCHRGIAREIATLLDTTLNHDPLTADVLEVKESDQVEVEVADTQLCTRYAIAVIEGVEVKDSPDWLKQKLEVLGQRSVNNIVDATNYVMLNMGQPLHAFDVDKLQGELKKITIRSAKEGEEITTLTDDVYTLTAETLLISDGIADTPIGIAGVKGGKQAEVDMGTTRIAIESAHFDPASVRKTAQRLKLWTEASTRFQNDPPEELVGYALAAVVRIILDIAGGQVEGGADEDHGLEMAHSVAVSVSRINALLGLSLSAREIEDIFRRAGLSFEQKDGAYVIEAPLERRDLHIPEDIIEEVGRIHGYEHLEAASLPLRTNEQRIHKEFAYIDRVRTICVAAGFSEVYGYTFQAQGDHKTIASLAADKAYLRSDLATQLKESLKKNHLNAPLLGSDRAYLFEIGRVFPKAGEHVAFAFGVSGKKTQKHLDALKERIEEELGASLEGGTKDGVFECHLSALIDELPEPKEYEAFEQNTTRFAPISPYPFVLRDIAVWVPADMSQEDIEMIIRKHGGDLLVRMDCFDRFERDGAISYAYHLVFQSHERTLSDEEVTARMEAIEGELNAIDGVSVR